MTKTGIEKASTANAMISRSIHVPTFHAAITPIGIAVATATSSVANVRQTVGSTRWPMSCITGRLVKIEMPRSPCSTDQTQVPKRTR